VVRNVCPADVAGCLARFVKKKLTGKDLKRWYTEVIPSCLDASTVPMSQKEYCSGMSIGVDARNGQTVLLTAVGTEGLGTTGFVLRYPATTLSACCAIHGRPLANPTYSPHKFWMCRPPEGVPEGVGIPCPAQDQ
jgi:hypothetical protein